MVHALLGPPLIITELSSDLGYYITSEDDFSHTLIGGAAQNITLNSKITLEQYTRILFLNYPGSNDGALLAIAPGDKIITAFRNNGVWEEKSSQFIATKSDLFTYEQKFENKDLNTIISPGCYGVGGKPSVSGVTNYPEDTTGMLVVFYNTGVTVQHYYTYLGSMYLRSKLVNYNDWSSWEKITK